MLEAVFKATRSDSHLAALVEESVEYAQIYLLAKQRHKGCSGTGEFMTLKEEFKDTFDKLIRYCRENNYLKDSCAYDPDSVADSLVKMNRQ